MKKKLFILVCAGIMITGCADKGTGKQEKPEVYSLDFGGNAQNDSENGEQTNNTAGSDVGEIVLSEDNAESREQEVESTSNENNEDIQNNENTQDLYMQFINNEVSVMIGNDYSQNDYMIFNLERGKSFTFAELGQYVNQSYFDPEYSEKSSYDYAQYTYVACPDSNSQNFLIKFVGLNIYAQGDDSFVVYVLTEDNGRLYLTGEYECWARSYTEQYRNGLCSSGGSGGAGDHYSGVSAILSNGKITDIYGAEILSGWWTSYVSEAVYNEVFGEIAEIPLEVSIYTVGESQYYSYDFSECTDEQVTLCETYINRCRDEAGINWTTNEEIQEAVRKRCISLGIDYNELEQQEEVKWIDA